MLSRGAGGRKVPHIIGPRSSNQRDADRRYYKHTAIIRSWLPRVGSLNYTILPLKGCKALISSTLTYRQTYNHTKILTINIIESHIQSYNLNNDNHTQTIQDIPTISRTIIE